MPHTNSHVIDVTGIVRTIAIADKAVPNDHTLADLGCLAHDLLQGTPSFEVAGLRAGWIHLAAQDDHEESFFHEKSERFSNAADWEELCLHEGLDPVVIEPTHVYATDKRSADELEHDGHYVVHDYVTSAIVAGAICDERGWYMPDAKDDLDSGAIAAYPSAKAMCEDLALPATAVDLPVSICRDFQGSILIVETEEIDGVDLGAHMTLDAEIAPEKPAPAAPRMAI